MQKCTILRECFFQADLRTTSIIVSVTTAGFSKNTKHYFVKTYKLSYSSDSVMWSYVMQAGSDTVDMVFTGNTDSSTHVTATLPETIATRYVRLYPQDYNNHMTTRWGINGCTIGKC